MKTGFEYLLKYFPNHDYHKPSVPKELLDYRNPKNIVGDVQRCFSVYWSLKGAEEGEIGIEMGCGEVIQPFCLGVDKYHGDSHPDYPSPTKANYHPHMVLRADKPLPFTDNSFAFLIAHHSLEHMIDTQWTLREWIRIVKPNGILAIIMPDAKYGGADDDESHKASYSAEQFKEEVLKQVEDLVDVVEYDTFKNNFSFNVVLKKK